MSEVKPTAQELWIEGNVKNMSKNEQKVHNLWKITLEQPLIEAEKRHEEKLKLKKQQNKEGGKNGKFN